MVLKFVGDGKVEKVIEEIDVVKESEKQEEQVSVAVVTEEAVSEVLTLVDRYTEIQRMIDEAGLAPYLKEQESVKKQLQLIAKSDNYPDEKPVRLCGTEGNYVEFTPKRNQTEITDKPGLINAMGQSTWNSLATITLEGAKQVLAESTLLKFTSKVPGSRLMKQIFYQVKKEVG
jgi:hypothetical protein